MLDGTPRFSIAQINAFGDIDNGESHQVFMNHDCFVLGRIVQLEIWFGKLLAGTRVASCQNCRQTTTLVKSRGQVSLAK